MSRTVEYTPTSTLERFHASNAFVRGVRGPIGSGKSVACCWEIWSRACEQAPGPEGIRRSRWVASRNTYGELTTTTLQTWLDWFPEHIFGKVVHGAPIEQVCRWPLDDGTSVELTMWFLALDRQEHVKKLLSLEVTGGWMNEAREQPKAILDAMTGRVGRFPSMRDGGASWFGVIMDTNPPDTDHWWYPLAEELHEPQFEFFTQPAGDSDQAENIENLPANYYRTLKVGKSDEWIRVYVKGDYGYVMDGKPVYPDYRDGVHCKDFELVKERGLHIGLDFGLTPAAIIGQQIVTGQWRWRRELVTEDTGVIRFAGLLKRFLADHFPGWKINSITGDPAGNQRQGGDEDERTVFQLLKAQDVVAEPARTNDFSIRESVVSAALRRLIDGEPGFLIHPDCKVTRKGMQGGYCYKRLAVAGDERYRDAPDKNRFSHPCEAGQYLMLGAGEAAKVMPVVPPTPHFEPMPIASAFRRR